MIENIDIKLGSSHEEYLEKIDISKPTILVGPNNSGKSLFLREVEQYLAGVPSTNMHIIDNIDLPDFTEESILDAIDPLRVPEEDNNNENLIKVKNPSVFGKEYGRQNINWELIAQYLENKKEVNEKHFLKDFYSLFTIRLDGKK